jgi:c-di-GMP-binding flagellar brake protein YcgR
MNKFFISIFFISFYASAESILSRIGWKGPSTSVIILIILSILSTVIFLFIYSFRQLHIQKKNQRQHSETVFMENAEEIGLTSFEINKVRKLLQHEKNLDPQIIFQSISMFEKCVDEEVKMIIDKNVSSEVQNEENDLLVNIRKKIGFHRLAFEHPLISTRNISIGQVGSIFGKNHKKPLINRATVVDSNEFTFFLQYNVDKENILYVSKGDEIKYAFSRQNDSVYGIALTIAASEGSGNIEVYHTTNLLRNQLRQHVRIEINLPIKFRLMHTVDREKSDIRVHETVESKMLDISGGGLSFICERSLRAGDIISASFDLPDNKYAGVMGKVLRISLQEGKYNTYYKHHVKFQDLDTRKRDSIVKYVFEKQRQVNQWR